jgi:hypothetical protein
MAKSTTCWIWRTVSAELRKDMKAVSDNSMISPAVRPTNLAPSEKPRSGGSAVATVAAVMADRAEAASFQTALANGIVWSRHPCRR